MKEPQNWNVPDDRVFFALCPARRVHETIWDVDYAENCAKVDVSSSELWKTVRLIQPGDDGERDMARKNLGKREMCLYGGPEC